MKQPPFYVITGGPGSGKTTALAELARRGHICVPEDARAIIQEHTLDAQRPPSISIILTCRRNLAISH